MAVTDTLLVTLAEARTWASSEVSLFATSDDYAAACIKSSQEVLRSVLGYDPFVHYEGRRRLAWYSPEADGIPYIWQGPGGAPIVQVSADAYLPEGEVAGYYTLVIGADGHSVEVDPEDPLPSHADFFEGWRGSFHSLDGAGSTVDLNGLPGLAGLTTLPAEVPLAIKTAILMGAVYIARQGSFVGVQTSEIDIGAQVKRMESLAPYNAAGGPELVRMLATQAHAYRRLYV